MGLSFDTLLSGLWEEFDGTTGLAIIFLTLTAVKTNQSFPKIIIIVALIFFAFMRGSIRSILRNKEYEDLEEGFNDLYDELIDKYSSGKFGRLNFWMLMFSSTVLISIELYAILLGINLWIFNDFSLGIAGILIWIYLFFKFFSELTEVVQSEPVRKFIVKLNRKLPGITLWPKKKDKSGN